MKKDSTLVKVYDVIQKDGATKVGINLSHVVSMGNIADREVEGGTLVHLRMINGDYLNVRADFDKLLTEVNSI